MSLTNWSKTEDARLIEISQAGMTVRQACDLMKRAETSIRRRAHDLGIRFNPARENYASYQPSSASMSEAADMAEYRTRDAAHVRNVLRANVYGFGRSIIVQPGSLA